MKLLKMVLIAAGIIFVISLFIKNEPSTITEENRVENQSINNSSSGKFTFVLTHLLGEKLTKDAYFYTGNMDKWELDFKNGDKLIYTIVYMNPNNPMCGITARDNLGDNCEICITKMSGDNVSVEFKYGSMAATYKGYLLR